VAKKASRVSAEPTSSKPPPPFTKKLSLSLEQQKVLQLVVAEGKNIFFTGSAGERELFWLPIPMLIIQEPVNPCC
jgi:hypothetical protein